MNEQIKYQKNLMEYALLVLQQMEFAKSLGASVTRMEELKNEYGKTMGTLAGELATIGKVSVTIHEEIKY